MASVRSNLRRIALLGGLAGLIMVSAAVKAGVDLPKLEHGKGEHCVEDTQYMRRHHMELLFHHRNETMHQGIRTTKYSLTQCVECHASSKTGSVAASKEDFCVACHDYAGVKLDCWDCHATKPMQRKTAPTAARPTPSPMLAGVSK